MMKTYIAIFLVCGFAAGCEQTLFGEGSPGESTGNPIHHELAPARLEHALATGDEIAVRNTGNGLDMTYKSTLNVGETDDLYVVPAGAADVPIVVDRHPIVAEFFHVGRLLVVTEGAENARAFHYFLEPVRWYTAPRGP